MRRFCGCSHYAEVSNQPMRAALQNRSQSGNACLREADARRIGEKHEGVKGAVSADSSLVAQWYPFPFFGSRFPYKLTNQKKCPYTGLPSQTELQVARPEC